MVSADPVRIMICIGPLRISARAMSAPSSPLPERLAQLRHRRFCSLAQWNLAIREKLEEVNARPFRKLQTSRRQLFETIERPALRPLPARRYGKLEALGLSAMATEAPPAAGGCPVRGAELRKAAGPAVDREVTWRENRRLQTRRSAAKLRQSATVEEIDFPAPRGLEWAVILFLAVAGWVRVRHNLLLTGATGCGKSFIACALAHSAIRNEHPAFYVRAPRLLSDLGGWGR